LSEDEVWSGKAMIMRLDKFTPVYV